MDPRVVSLARDLFSFANLHGELFDLQAAFREELLMLGPLCGELFNLRVAGGRKLLELHVLLLELHDAVVR